MLPTPLYFSPLHHQHHFSLLGVYFRLEAKSSLSASEVEKKVHQSVFLCVKQIKYIGIKINRKFSHSHSSRYDRRCVVCRLVRVINRIIYVSRTYRSAQLKQLFLYCRPLLWCSVRSLVTLRKMIKGCRWDGNEKLMVIIKEKLFKQKNKIVEIKILKLNQVRILKL